MLAFLLIVVVSFSAIARLLTGLVGDSLFAEKTRAEQRTVESLATRLSDIMADMDGRALYTAVQQAGSQLGGRLLVLDTDGKVQADSFSAYNGMRLQLAEVISILQDGKSVDYGFHLLPGGGARQRPSWLDVLGYRDLSQVWVGYFTAAMQADGRPLGVLLYSSQVQDMVDSMTALRDEMTLYFLVAALGVVLLSLLVSRWITKPIAALTKGIEQTTKGDFTSRVRVSGGGEMARLAETYNLMSERLENLDNSRNQFVSNASHELKTPLATMKILLESLIYQEDMDPALRREFMQDINKEIDRLNMVIGDLLTLVHIDSHKMKLRREMMTLSTSVKEAVRRLAPLASDRGQEIEVALHDPCEMFADPAKLQQVMYNLVDNAIKYTPDGGRVRITLERMGRDAVLKIADTGVGIPKEDLPHVFQRFYRVDKARSRETGGTGLGLSIVQQIVRLHGGSIDVESDQGKGTTFILQLPVK
ncbi:MAG: HAMP domain-containing histidine kinase [Oscillospiraceae bacterium]|nr:HAMP domain-containing histidine kinase [Oscillospiraceae bacterium]